MRQNVGLTLIPKIGVGVAQRGKICDTRFPPAACGMRLFLFLRVEPPWALRVTSLSLAMLDGHACRCGFHAGVSEDEHIRFMKWDEADARAEIHVSRFCCGEDRHFNVLSKKYKCLSCHLWVIRL